MAESDERTGPADDRPESRPASCPNCGTAAGGPFCPECGQDQRIDPRSVVQWVKDAADDFLGMSGKLPRTLKDLFRPGILTREWLKGRRRRYVHPLRLFLVSGLLLFAAPRLSPSEPYATVDLVELTMDEIGATVWDHETDRAVVNVGPTVMILVAPLFAGMLKLLYMRSGRVYAEHLVHTLNFHSVAFLLFASELLLLEYGEAIPNWLQIIVGPLPLALIVAHLYGGLRRVYGSSPFGAVARSAALLAVQLFVIAAGLVLASDRAFDRPQDEIQEARSLYRAFREARSEGDTVRSGELLPRALVAYARGELHVVDACSRYHLADLMLEAAERDPDVEAKMRGSALRLLQECLVVEPERLLCLGMAAETARALDRPELAAEFWQRFRNADSGDADSWGHGAHLAAYRSAAVEAEASETPRPR